MRILVIGAGGRLGRVFTRVYGSSFDLILCDINPIDDPRYVQLDVGNVQQVRDVIAYCDVIIHLAIVDQPSFGTDVLGYDQAAFNIHVTGLYNVLQAAADAGGKRILYASTISAVDCYPQDEIVGSNHRIKGSCTYGLTKGLGEEICRHFHERRKLPIVILRLGNVYFEGLNWDCNRGVEPSRVDSLDVVQAFAKVLRHPHPQYALIHIVGDNIGCQYDLEAAYKLFGWKPIRRFSDNGKPLN